jgi:hypothetical protein
MGRRTARADAPGGRGRRDDLQPPEVAEHARPADGRRDGGGARAARARPRGPRDRGHRLRRPHLHRRRQHPRPRLAPRSRALRGVRDPPAPRVPPFRDLPETDRGRRQRLGARRRMRVPADHRPATDGRRRAARPARDQARAVPRRRRLAAPDAADPAVPGEDDDVHRGLHDRARGRAHRTRQPRGAARRADAAGDGAGDAPGRIVPVGAEAAEGQHAPRRGDAAGRGARPRAGDDLAGPRLGRRARGLRRLPGQASPAFRGR